MKIHEVCSAVIYTVTFIWVQLKNGFQGFLKFNIETH